MGASVRISRQGPFQTLASHMRYVVRGPCFAAVCLHFRSHGPVVDVNVVDQAAEEAATVKVCSGSDREACQPRHVPPFSGIVMHALSVGMMRVHAAAIVGTTYFLRTKAAAEWQSAGFV